MGSVSRTFSDPTTDEEWQDAVDSAYVMLVLDSAQKYELVSGGPVVNVDRCEEILARGAAHGFQPASDAIARLISRGTPPREFPVADGDS